MSTRGTGNLESLVTIGIGFGFWDDQKREDSSTSAKKASHLRMRSSSLIAELMWFTGGGLNNLSVGKRR